LPNKKQGLRRIACPQLIFATQPLKDDREDDHEDLPEPAILAQEAIGELEAAIAELQGILQELGEEISL